MGIDAVWKLHQRPPLNVANVRGAVSSVLWRRKTWPLARPI